MNRSVTNFIRYCMDELLPPLIRDSRWFMRPFYFMAYGPKNLKTIMNFKKHVWTWSDDEFKNFYKSLDSISKNRETDLNNLCFNRILTSIDKNAESTVLDVGCGNGLLLRTLKQKHPSRSFAGLDINTDLYSQGSIYNLAFEDQSVDIVICTHVLEHCVDLQKAMSEIKRVAAQKVIIVVPKQRAYFYTLDEHVHFFPYKEKMLYELGLPDPNCELLDGDWYIESNVSRGSHIEGEL